MGVKQSAAMAILCAAVSACGDGGVYVMSERYEIVEDMPVYAGGGCAVAFDSWGAGTVSSGGGTVDQDYTYTEMRVGSSYVVVISSQGRELERREYSRKELLSGERDEFTITTQGGRTYQLTYWGGTECEEPDGE